MGCDVLQGNYESCGGFLALNEAVFLALSSPGLRSLFWLISYLIFFFQIFLVIVSFVSNFVDY